MNIKYALPLVKTIGIRSVESLVELFTPITKGLPRLKMKMNVCNTAVIFTK